MGDIWRLAQEGDRISLVSKVLKPFRKLASRVCGTRVRWQNRASNTQVLVLRWSNLSTWNSSFLDSRSIWRTKMKMKTIWRSEKKKIRRKKKTWSGKYNLKNADLKKKNRDLEWRTQNDLNWKTLIRRMQNNLNRDLKLRTQNWKIWRTEKQRNFEYYKLEFYYGTRVLETWNAIFPHCFAKIISNEIVKNLRPT